MEVTQFTYFQQVGGIECDPVSTELTYGLERLAMYMQGVDNVYDLDFNGAGVTYGDVFLQAEQRILGLQLRDAPNTDAPVPAFQGCRGGMRSAARPQQARCLPAYDQCLEGQPPLQPARRPRRDLA